MKKALISLTVLAALTACNDSSSDRAETTPTPSPSPSTSPTATPDPGSSPEPSASPSASPQPTATPDPGEKGVCLVPVSRQATTTVTSGTGCAQCTVTDADAVTTLTDEDTARMTVSLGVLPEGGLSDLSLQVNLLLEQDPGQVPMSEEVLDEQGNVLEPARPLGPAPANPGFVVSFPDPSILTIGLAPTLTVDALAGESIVGTSSYGFGFFDMLAVGSPLFDINNARVYLPVTAEGNYDAVRLSITGGAATALLDLDVHRACIAGVGGSISGDF